LGEIAFESSANSLFFIKIFIIFIGLLAYIFLAVKISIMLAPFMHSINFINWQF